MAHSGTIIYMRNVPGRPKERALTRPLPAKNFDGTEGEIPTDKRWDGSSVPWIFQGLFPRHRHPIASCRHDDRCERAKGPAERKWADQEFRKDVRKTSWRITAGVGFAGVRIGAFIKYGLKVNPK